VLRESHALLESVLVNVPVELTDLCSLDGYSRLVGMLDLVTKDLERPNPLDGAIRSETLPVRALTDLRKISLLWANARLAEQDVQIPTSPETESDDEASVAGDVDAEGCMNLVPVADRLSKLPVLPGFAGFGLVETVALMNHSCAENVSVTVSADTLDVIGTATRDITQGEELLMSYLDSSKPRAWRQRYLYKNYGFNCKCERCQREVG